MHVVTFFGNGFLKTRKHTHPACLHLVWIHTYGFTHEYVCIRHGFIYSIKVSELPRRNLEYAWRYLRYQTVQKKSTGVADSLVHESDVNFPCGVVPASTMFLTAMHGSVYLHMNPTTSICRVDTSSTKHIEASLHDKGGDKISLSLAYGSPGDGLRANEQLRHDRRARELSQ